MGGHVARLDVANPVRKFSLDKDLKPVDLNKLNRSRKLTWSRSVANNLLKETASFAPEMRWNQPENIQRKKALLTNRSIFLNFIRKGRKFKET